MTAIDPATSLRIVHCDRMMRAAHHGQYRDLGGALALTSDEPTPAFNHLEGFDARERDVEMLLDVGFSLLRAFDCEPAVLLTPLDRPKSIARHLLARRLVPGERDTAMLWRGDLASITKHATAVDIRRIEPEQALTFAEIV